MNWKIAKQTNTKMLILNRFGESIGSIVMQKDLRWKVTLAVKFDFIDTYERCIGYVRGIERAVSIYGQEVYGEERSKRRA